MATTAESIQDALLWLAKLLAVFAKRGLLVGAAIGLFALAIWATGGDRFTDCDEVTAQQRAQLDAFRESSDLAVRADSAPACWDGAIAASASGPRGRIENVIEDLADDGWTNVADLWPPQYDLHVACFRSDDPMLETVELNVSSSRAGTVGAAELRITSGHRACESYSCDSVASGCDRWDRLSFPR